MKQEGLTNRIIILGVHPIRPKTDFGTSFSKVIILGRVVGVIYISYSVKEDKNGIHDYMSTSLIKKDKFCMLVYSVIGMIMAMVGLMRMR